MRKLLLFAVAAISFQTVAWADLITYTEQVTATGSLGANNFTDALVTISFSGDTANVTNPSSGIFQNTLGVANVAIVGVGTAMFTDLMGALVNQTQPSAGISDFTSNRATLFTNDPAFATYTLTTAIGPVSAVGDTNLGLAFPTNIGLFSFTSLNSSVTYTATTAVSEPASYGLVGIGLAVIIVYEHRRRKRNFA